MREGFLVVGGVRVHCLEFQEVAEPKLLFVHGLGGSVERWVDVFRGLSRDFYVIAVDLPGFGRSDKPDAPYTIDYFADFICSFTEAVGCDSAFLVGHSMGGTISIKTYLRCSERVKGLVLIDAAGVSGAAAEIIKRCMGDGWNMERLRRFYLNHVLGRFGRLDEKRLREIIQMMDDPAYRRAYLRSLDAISKPLSAEEIEKIRAPTLIIWGSDDRLTPLEDGVKLHGLIPGSRFVILKGVGHSPHSEAPEKIVEEVRKFVLEG